MNISANKCTHSLIFDFVKCGLKLVLQLQQINCIQLLEIWFHNLTGNQDTSVKHEQV